MSADWTQLAPVTVPQAVYGQGMAYDSDRDMVVMFGGYRTSAAAGSNRTYEFDGTDWTRRFPSTIPGARWWIGMAYDPVNQLTVMFGGNNGSGVSSPTIDETWVWDGSNWYQLSPSTTPTVGMGYGIAWDSVREKVVMVTGLPETWTWDGTDWTLETPSNPITDERFWPGMTFDDAGYSLLYGGDFAGARSDTWTYDTDWTELSPATTPGGAYPNGLFAPTMSFDTSRSVAVMAGSQAADTDTDTWEWDGTDWALQAPTDSPSGRAYAASCWDSTRDRVLLFGGSVHGAEASNDETWSYEDDSPPPVTQYQRIYGWTLNISDDALETVDPMLTSPIT